MTDKALRDTIPHWSQFLPNIAKRSKETVAELIAKVARKDVQPFLIWDETTNKAVALVGVAYHRRGADLVGEMVWFSDLAVEHWAPMMSELEQYLKEHIGCAVIRPVCRPGIQRFLRGRGYRLHHVQMEKVL